jgi:hypothetical protein
MCMPNCPLNRPPCDRRIMGEIQKATKQSNIDALRLAREKIGSWISDPSGTFRVFNAHRKTGESIVSLLERDEATATRSDAPNTVDRDRPLKTKL